LTVPRLAPSLLTLSLRQGTLRCAILTLFPEAIRPYLDESILGIAQAQGKLRVDLVDFRNYAYWTRIVRSMIDRSVADRAWC
jgi:tRNA G37 N-methylase TrmD